jgi:hypothetical protein
MPEMSMPQHDTVSPDLLYLLEAFVARDGAFPGFRARLAVGVHVGGYTQWWQANLGARAEASLVDAPSADVDCAVLMSQAQAQSIVTGAELPGPPMTTFGDAALFERFLDRYLKRQNILQLRGQS